MGKRMEARDTHMLAGMSSAEIEQFLTLLDRVRDNLERMNAEYDDRQKHGDSPIRVEQSAQIEQSAYKKGGIRNVTDTGCTDQRI